MSDDTRTRLEVDDPQFTVGAEAEADREARENRGGPIPVDGGSTTARAATGGTIGQASLWSDAWLELRRNPFFMVSAVLVAVFCAMAIAPQLFTSVNPRDCDLSRSLIRPSAQHWFGFAFQGCDSSARLISGPAPRSSSGSRSRSPRWRSRWSAGRWPATTAESSTR